jgi:hypothetical protein
MHAHKVVAHVAAEMAQGVYEECAKDNAWYAMHKDRNAFVRELAPRLVHTARGVLAEMLKEPGRSEADKRHLYQALLDDVTIPRGGKSFVQ